MTVLLILLSLAIAGAAALLVLTQATAGVGIICIGVLLAILARINQAQNHHNDLRAAIAAQTAELRQEIQEIQKSPYFRSK